MASVPAQTGDRDVSIGRVFSRGFGTIGSNPVATLGVAFLFSTVPTIAINYAVISQIFTPDTLALLGMAGAIAAGIFTLVIMIVLAMITQGALVRATTAYSEGRKASFAESAMAGLSVALPLFLVGLLGGLGIMVGLVLLVVPGIILYIMWSVAAPALVEERLGPIEALGRSRYLTRGARWKVFGLNLVILVIYWLFSYVVARILTPAGTDMTDPTAGLQAMTTTFILVTAVVQTITSVVWGVLQSSLYVELRDWKDGPRTEKLAEVFA